MKVMVSFSLMFLLIFNAYGAEITETIDAADKDDPFDLNIDVNFTWDHQKTEILREFAKFCNDQSYDYVCDNQIDDVKEIVYGHDSFMMNFTLEIGIYKDLEIFGTLPLILNSSESIDYASGVTSDDSTIAADNLFEPGMKFFSKGLGDLKLGLRWEFMNQERDPWYFQWAVGLDVTVPSGKIYDPTKDAHSKTTATGTSSKLWKFRIYTAGARRFKVFEPYAYLYYELPVRGSNTYYDLKDKPYSGEPPSTTHKIDECYYDPDSDKYKCYITGQQKAGFKFGSEIVAWEDKEVDQKMAFDVQFFFDYYGEGRMITPLSFALQEATYTDDYARMGGHFGIVLMMSSFVKFTGNFNLGYEMNHFITNEDTGVDMDGDGKVKLNDYEQNPTYDPRYDVTGARFRTSSTLLMGATGTLFIMF